MGLRTTRFEVRALGTHDQLVRSGGRQVVGGIDSPDAINLAPCYRCGRRVSGGMR
jgi:hypothetical protein